MAAGSGGDVALRYEQYRPMHDHEARAGTRIQARMKCPRGEGGAESRRWWRAARCPP